MYTTIIIHVMLKLTVINYAKKQTGKWYMRELLH